MHSAGTDRTYKVGRVLDRHGLGDLRDELPGRWTGDDGEASSLRELARTINVRIIEELLEEAGELPLDGEAENVYRLLTDDSVSAGMRTQQREQLERAGVDVEQLERDLVTHQAVHTYLTEGVGVSKRTGDTTIEKHKARVQRLRGRLDAVVDQSVTELQGADELAIDDPDVTISIRINCRSCHTQFSFLELVENGGCRCEQ